MKKKIIIIGSGLAGLSAAWHLKRKGIASVIFEKEPDIGGLCRSRKVHGFTFDCDGHLLHFRHNYTFNLIKHLLADNLLEHRRSAWIYAFNTFIRYPFQANLYGLPASVVKECLLGFIASQVNGQRDSEEELNFSEWVQQTFGQGLSRHFFIPYNKKFWTLPLRQLTCQWQDGFIPIPSLGEVVEGAIKESQRQFGYNARFWYPRRGGIQQVPLAFARNLKSIFTGCLVTSIDLHKREVRLSSGARERFDYLVCTLPLPELNRIAEGLPLETRALFKKLRWNSIFNLNLGIRRRDSIRRHWVYFPDNSLSFFRVGFFHNFSASLSPQGKHSLYVEVAHSKDRPIDKRTIVSRIIKDLCRVGLIASKDDICVQEIVDIQYGYPIYDHNYQTAREKIIQELGRYGLIPCGRYGSWKYMSMEDAILDGRSVAERALAHV